MLQSKQNFLTKAAEAIMGVLPRGITDRINAAPYARRLAKGAFWVLVGTIATRVLRIPVSIALARLMGPATYGELNTVSGSIDLFATFAGFGLGLTATKYIAKFRTRDPQRAGNILAVSRVVAITAGALFAILLYWSAPWLAAHTLANPGLAIPLKIGAVSLLFSAMNGAQMGALYGFEDFRGAARMQAMVGLLDLPYMLIGYFAGGLNGVLWGMACSRFSAWLLTGFALRVQVQMHGIEISFSHWKRELGVLWRFSMPAALASIMVVPVNWICSTLLVNQPGGYAAMGMYGAASQWGNVLLFLPTALGSGLLPMLSDQLGQRDVKNAGSILKTMLTLNGILIIPCAMGLSALSLVIMRTYGPGYSDGWSTLVAVVWAAAILGILTPVGNVIAASGRMWLGLLMNLGWAVVYITATILLVRWGSVGLATARLIAYAVHAIWTFAFAYRVLERHSDISPSRSAKAPVGVV